MKQKSDKLAFVLSGGGSLGAIQVGCLEALLEEGVIPDLIVGTSIGAINGAWLAKYPNLYGMTQLEKLWLSYTKRGIFSDSRAKQLLRLFGGRNHLYTNTMLRKSLCQQMHCNTTFEELAIPLYVTAADLQTGKQKVFNKGPLMPSILASTAIPGVLEPVVIDGATYVDGAIINNCSIETAWSAGATTIVAIECPHPRPSDGYGVLDILKQAAWVSLGRLCHLERERFKEHCNLIVLEPDIGILEHQEITDFSNTRVFIEKSKQWTKQFINNGNPTAHLDVIRRWKPPYETIQPHFSVIDGGNIEATCYCSDSSGHRWCGACK
jgi:predicted acylesterase/phospholipase RssA